MTDPVIKLGGKDYPVPLLVPKQLKHVIPDMMKALPAMMDFAITMKNGGLATYESKLTTETFDQLLRVVYWGVIWPNDPNRGEPVKAIKFQQLEEMSIGLSDIMAAVMVVQKQSGLFRPSQEGDMPGESQPDAASPT